MHTSSDLLLVISLAIAFTSMVISSRKSGYVIMYALSFKDKYSIDKNRIEDYARRIVVVAVFSIGFGLMVSQQIEAALAFMAINLLFIGYALAWEMLFKSK